MIAKKAYHRLILSWVLGTLCLSLSSCAGRPLKPAISPEQQKMVRQDLARLLSQEDYHSLSGYAQVQVERRGGQDLFDAAILLSAPDKLLIEIMDDFGRLKYRVVADGVRVLFYEPETGEWSLTPQQGEALKKALHLPLSVEEFIARTLSQVPQAPILQIDAGTHSSPEGTNSWFEITRDRDRLRVQKNPLRLTGFELFESPKKKKKRYDVTYQDFENHGDQFFYRSLHWAFKRPKVKVWIHFQDLSLDGIIPLEKFDTSPPLGMGER